MSVRPCGRMSVGAIISHSGNMVKNRCHQRRFFQAARNVTSYSIYLSPKSPIQFVTNHNIARTLFLSFLKRVVIFGDVVSLSYEPE